MADVTVEFGAKDAGLSQTLKNVQKELADLDTQQKKTAMSADEFQRSLSRTKQLEGMEKKLRSMSDATSNLGGFFDSSFAKITGAFTLGNIAADGFNKAINLAFSGAQSVARGFGDALDLGGRLTDLSARTGEAAGKLLVLETAFKNSGLGAEMVGTVINKLQNFMQDAANGGDKQATAMTDLGISLAELKGKTPTEQMKIFADKIAAIEDPTQRAAMASEVFGEKLGGKLLPLLMSFSPAIDDARGKVGSMERVMNENAATFDAAGEKIDAVKGKMAAFAAGILSEVIPAVDGLGTSMENVDAAGLGQEIGSSLNPILEESQKKLSELIKEYREYAIVTSAAARGDAETANSTGKATGALDLLGVMVKSVVGPLHDLVTGTTTYIDESNRLAESAKKAGLSVTDFVTLTQAGVQKIADLGANSQKVAEKIGELGEKAKETGAEIGSAFSLSSDFKPAIDGISSAWSNFNSEITGTTPLLESNYSLSESIAGKIDEQTQGIGDLNKQLDVSKSLEEQIKNIKTVRLEKEKESADKERERQSELRASLDLDLEILKAQISGNEQEKKAVQYKKDYNAALKQAIDAGMGQPQAKSFADEIARARQEQAGMNKELSTSASLLKGIAQAESQQRVDPGGKLQQKAQQQVQKNQFVAAKRTAEQIRFKELETSLRYGGPKEFQNSGGRDSRDIGDIGKSYGVRQAGDSTSDFMERIKRVREGLDTVDKFGRNIREGEKISREDPFAKYKDLKTGKELTKEQKDAMKREEKDKKLKDEFGKDAKAKMDQPGKDGKKEDGKKEQKEDKMANLVEKIEKLVEKIEKKLPQQALAY
jgi:hypothetical protein